MKRGRRRSLDVALDSKFEQPETLKIVRKLLNDHDKDAMKPLIYALPGLPLPGDIEERMVWAMSNTIATDDARPLILATLQRIADSTTGGYRHNDAKRGLALHGQPTAQ